MFDRIQFLLGEALVALRRNGWMTFAAISTVAVSLFLIGGLGFVYLQLSAATNDVSSKFELRVMLKDGTTQAQISDTAKQIRSIPGVKNVNWIPRDKAWERFLQEHSMQQDKDIENPLPDAFKVVLSDLKSTDSVVASIKSLPAVVADEVIYLKDEQQLFEQLQAVVKWLATGLGGLLFISGGILIYNAIRLTVISRRIEIRIMQLVGASFLTVRIPFYIEGIVQGAAGGCLASALLVGCRSVLDNKIADMMPMMHVPPFPTSILTLLVGLGAVYGLVCSMVAVRAPLRYR